MKGRPAALAGLFFSPGPPDCMFRRSRASQDAQTRSLTVGAIVVVLDFRLLLHPIGDPWQSDEGGQMEQNQAAQQLLDAFLEKWKAEERLREAEARLRKVLSQPKSAPLKRRI